MSDAVIIAAIAAIPSSLSAAAAYMAYKTHRIVNGQMLIQLKLHAKTSRALANIKDDPETRAIAELAEKMLEEHKDKLLSHI